MQGNEPDTSALRIDGCRTTNGLAHIKNFNFSYFYRIKLLLLARSFWRASKRKTGYTYWIDMGPGFSVFSKALQIAFSVAIFHVRTVQSKDAEAKVLPLGENASDVM